MLKGLFILITIPLNIFVNSFVKIFFVPYSTPNSFEISFLAFSCIDKIIFLYSTNFSVIILFLETSLISANKSFILFSSLCLKTDKGSSLNLIM